MKARSMASPNGCSQRQLPKTGISRQQCEARERFPSEMPIPANIMPPQRWDFLAPLKISSEIGAAALGKKSPINQPEAELAECYSQLGDCRDELADFDFHFAADLARRHGRSWFHPLRIRLGLPPLRPFILAEGTLALLVELPPRLVFYFLAGLYPYFSNALCAFSPSRKSTKRFASADSFELFKVATG